MNALKRYTTRLFIWIEKQTRINIRERSKELGWLFSGQTVGIASALLLALGYAHFLPKETYGTYKYVFAIFGLLTVFSLPGMSDGAQRAIAQGHDGAFWPTFRKRLKWGTIGALCSAGIGVYYLLNGNTLLGAVFCAAAPFIPFLESLSHYNSLLFGKQLFKRSTQYSIAIQLIASVVIFSVVVLTESLLALVVLYLATFIILRGIAFWHVTRTTPINNVPDNTALHYGKHMSITNIFGMTAGQIDTILLWHFLGPIPLAIYSFAQAASDQLRKVFKLTTTIFAFAKFTARDKETIQKTLPRKILIAHVATVPLAGISVLLIPYAYHFLFPTYVESIPYAQVMIALLAFSPVRMLSTAINAKGSTKDIYTVSILGSSLQTAFLIAFIPLFGIWGAIFANPAQIIITNLVSYRLFKKM